MTFQEVGPSGPVTEQMPAFYNQAVADGSNKEVVMPAPSGWCGRSPVAGHCLLLSTLHFQCHWRTLSSVLGKGKYLFLLPASVLKAEFIFAMYHCPQIPFILALGLFPVCSLVVEGLIDLAATLSEMGF